VRSLWLYSAVWRKACITAFQFMTRLYLPFNIEYTDDVNRRSVVFYPWVGAVIGVILLIAALGVTAVLPAVPAGICVLILWVALTGALHLDGLLDTADGILSHRPRAQMLEIMKDSRVGAMGVVVCVLYLLLKAGLIISLMEQAERASEAMLMLVFIPVWSRWFMVWSITAWPYARKDNGMGSSVRQSGIRYALLATAGVVIASGILILALDPGHYISWPGWVMMISVFAGVSGLAGWLISAYLNSKLGGLTGDTYGAVNELLELFLLMVALWLIEIL
jgi:adenosylcobinamide-GDP ribazoletransferase